MSQPTWSEMESDRPIVWIASEVKTPPFSDEARREAGYLLRLLQRGDSLSLPHSRPMPTIGRGCHELRIRDRDATWRIVYHVDAVAVVVLEVFSKKTQATPKKAIEAVKRRLAEYRRALKG